MRLSLGRAGSEGGCELSASCGVTNLVGGD